MPQLSEEELALALHQRRAQALYVPHMPYEKAKLNDCHENARLYAEEHPECVPVHGWLIEQFVGWNYFLAHTVIQRPDGSFVDPTPMSGSHPFLIHQGSEEEFHEQRLNRPQVQYVFDEMTEDEWKSLFSELGVIDPPADNDYE